jgi:uncharacterized membrane protein YbhN (UPF0104 family)
VKKILDALKSPWVRGAFLVAALGAAVWAVASQWDTVVYASRNIPWWLILAALGLSILYVAATMLSWRAVLRDLGSHLGIAPASRLFFVSQVGKYLPGGVWNIVAAAEMGKDIDIPRRRSVTGMVVALLISIVTAVALAVGAVALDPHVRDDVGWIAWLLPVFIVLLAPPVLNRLIGLALRIVGRPALEHPLSARGIGSAAAWAVVGWLLAGAQVWLLAVGVGLEPTIGTFARCVSGYALAWVVGFLVVFVPAGAGVREGVLGILLAGLMDSGEIVVVVLASRVLLTVVDLGLGLAAGVLVRNRVAEVGGADPADQQDPPASR